MLIDFCLPARNEAKILQTNVLKLRDFLEAQKFPFDWQIVIIVNGSNDDSYAIATKLVADGGGRLKLESIEPASKGLALRHYFNKSRADILVFMDVDLAVALDNIPALLDPLLSQTSSLVIGSRLLPNSHTIRSWSRSITSKIYNRLSRFILAHSFSDLQCGFKAMRRELFQRVAPLLQDNNWFFDTELVILAWHNGDRIQEIPVDWRENRYDKRASKVKVWIDAWSFVKNLFYLRHRLKGFKKHPDNV